MAAKAEVANPVRASFASGKNMFNLKGDIFNTAVSAFPAPFGQQILFNLKPE
jgi:hypothetical protein